MANFWRFSTITAAATILMLVAISTDPTRAEEKEKGAAAAGASTRVAVELDDSNMGFAREKGIKFFVQDKKKTDLYELRNLDVLSTAKYWNRSSSLIVIIHGWMEQATPDIWRPRPFEPLQELRSAYADMKRDDNVILVDWSRYSKMFRTKEADKGSRIAGNATGTFIWKLKNSGVLGNNAKNYKSVHLIGFGMGATVAGVAGDTIQQLSFNMVGRITGLDPPLLDDSAPLAHQLDKGDAWFVDNIHCSLTPHSYRRPLGDITSSASGHVDFYPEGGIWQNGCEPWLHFLDIPFLSATCGHLKCPYLYASTIRGSKFHGCTCKDYESFHFKDCNCKKTGPLLGEFCDEKARGVYFIDTNEAQSPAPATATTTTTTTAAPAAEGSTANVTVDIEA